MLIRFIYIRPCLQQKVHDGRVALLAREEERRGVATIRRVHVDAAARNDIRHLIRMTLGTGFEQAFCVVGDWRHGGGGGTLCEHELRGGEGSEEEDGGEAR